VAPTSEVFIQATGTDPAVRAQEAIREDHERLRAELAALTGQAARAGQAVRAGQEGDGGSGPEPGSLAEFCTGELRRRMSATDRTLYAAASGAAETRLLVRALRRGLSELDRHIDALGAGGDPAAAGRVIEALLAVQLSVEETVLLPALAALPGADLRSLVADRDILLSGGRLEDPAVLDVREIPHGRRHPRIFARYARLAPGEAFTIVNNHDPKPLRREFEATHPGAYTWDYDESDPELWRVRIGRTAVDG